MGGRGVNLNLDNVFKYTVCFFWTLPLMDFENGVIVKICKSQVDPVLIWTINQFANMS